MLLFSKLTQKPKQKQLLRHPQMKMKPAIRRQVQQLRQQQQQQYQQFQQKK
jgi:hypothetical protein